MKLVDLGHATWGASPEDCEHELHGLQGTLESVVSRTAAAATALHGELQGAPLSLCGGAILLPASSSSW